MKRYAVLSTPCGLVGIVATVRGLSHVVLMKGPAARGRSLLARRHPDAQHDPNLLPSLQEQLRDYFAGRRVNLRVKLDLSSVTPFQHRVLQACAQIGYGRTATYGQLARQIGRPTAARAVGAALARNPVPLVVPCHRIIAADGSLGGFSAQQGVSLKRWLLTLESKGR